MSNDRLLRFERAATRSVMAEIQPCELRIGISRHASRRNRVGIGVCGHPASAQQPATRISRTSSSSWATTSAGCSRASITRAWRSGNAQHRPHRA